jgi:hypothetical protein
MTAGDDLLLFMEQFVKRIIVTKYNPKLLLLDTISYREQRAPHWGTLLHYTQSQRNVNIY